MDFQVADFASMVARPQVDRDKIKDNEILNQIEDIKEQWDKGWIRIDIFETLVKEFLIRLNSNKASHELKYNFDWEEYFSESPIINQCDYRLHNDLESLLSFVEESKTIGENYVGFRVDA